MIKRLGLGILPFFVFSVFLALGAPAQAQGISQKVAVCDWAGPTYCTKPGNAPSYVTPVTGSFTGTGQSATFVPISGRDFNVSAWGTFVGSFQLERSFDGGTTWLPITAAGTQLYTWTAPESETASEPEYGVQYRVRVTSYTSGTLNVRISQ